MYARGRIANRRNLARKKRTPPPVDQNVILSVTLTEKGVSALAAEIAADPAAELAP